MAQITEHEQQIEEKMSTVLAPDIDFKGTLKFKKSLMVKGKVEGNIKADGHLVVGSSAKVKATVDAGRVTNYGEITGDMDVNEVLEMKDRAIQTGDVKTGDLIIESGCRINGKVEMPENGKGKKNQ